MLKIIIVEGDHTLAQVISNSLYLTHGIESQMVYSGYELLASLEKNKPDALLLEVDLPDLNGFQIVRTLKNSTKWKNLPLLIFTARELTGDEVSKLKLGPTVVMYKSTVELIELGNILLSLIAGTEQ